MLKNYKSFTLLEILLVIAAFAILLGVSFPLYSNLFQKNDLDTAVTITTEAIYRARLVSKLKKNEDGWSVYLTDDKVVVYKGDDYALRDIIFDEEYSLPGSVSVSGLNDINFLESVATTSDIGIITVISNSGDTVDIEIVNLRGVLEY